MSNIKRFRNWIVVFLVFALSFYVKAGSVNYDFKIGIPEGIVVQNAPASIIDGALSIIIDENSTKWTASMLIDINEDIFDNPVLRLRYKVGSIQAGISAYFPITLMIDDLYTQNGDQGTWRIYPEVNLSTGEWQDLEIDLSPLIASWESTHGTDHGNIQQLMMFIGNNNGPFIGEQLFIDYIRIGDMLSVGEVEINPANFREIIVDLGVPVSGSPVSSDFTVRSNGTPLAIDTVFFRDGSNLVVMMEYPIDIPREVLEVPSLEIAYDGNADIKDSLNVLLEPFVKPVSFKAYAEDNWKYWGKYEFSDVPYPSPWHDIDTVLKGWDWSLPEFVEADSFAYFWYRDIPDLDFSCKNLNSVYVSWNELEPTRGQYNFQLLRDRIINNAKGYDGIVLRVLASVWNIDSYPTPGGYVPTWLADRDNAPRWMDNLDIAKIPANNAIDGKYLITNMDIMDPDYHSLYLKFIEELGKSGIPQMEELKIVNVCYRSGSAGEEFTAYDASNNSIEAQYSSQIIEERTKERLKVWSDAFGNSRHKLMWVGHDHKAYIKYAGELGLGSRQGFIEMYNSYVHMPQFGITINPESRYGEVDETNDFIIKDVAFGDENEEYTNELRFGWKESFPYRYYISSFRMLQMRRNYVMHAGNTLNPELTWYVGMGLGRKVKDTPDAWALLSEFYISPWANKNEDGSSNAGPIKNIERWLYQRDMPGYETSPAMKVPTAKDLWYADNTKPYDFTARKAKKMGFNVDDRFLTPGEQSMAVKISFYDGVAGTLKLIYENNEGQEVDSVITTGQDEVRTATFFIDARMDDTGFDYDFDFLLESDEEVPVFFVRVIKTEAVYENTDQSPFGGIKRTIPGFIEGEHYDESTDGFGFNDDDIKEGDLSQRPGDNVDIVARANASNGLSIGYTNEGEWLEYTVDVTSGNYDISLYYFCGEPAGDLLVSLDGEVLDTIRGLENRGWETQNVITVEKISISGGNNKILRLEFVGGAGFDIDAIEFNEVSIPVTGVSLGGCPSDTLIEGDAHQLSAILNPTNPDDPSVTWNSSNNSVLAVDDNGVITALSEGSATITLTTRDGGFTDQCEIRVKKAIIPVLSVRLDNCPGFILDAGDIYQLSANVNPPDATDPSVSWNSSDTVVANVDGNGIITAVSEGTATITVTTIDGGYSNSCTIGVNSTSVNNILDYIANENRVKVYPNPVSHILHFEFPGTHKEKKINIYDIYGHLLMSKITYNTKLEIDIKKFNHGKLLMVQIISKENSSSYIVLTEH